MTYHDDSNGAIEPLAENYGKMNGSDQFAPAPETRYGEDVVDEINGDPRLASIAAFVACISLGKWAGNDPIKDFAVSVVIRQTGQSVKDFALENHVSESFVHRRIKEARAVISSPP